jgi:cell division protease FtsH
MKISRIARLIALCVCAFAGTIQTEQKSAQTIQLSQQECDFINALFNAGLSCVQQIDTMIERLSIMVTKNEIKGLANREEVKRIFMADRQMLIGVRQSLGSIQDPIEQIQLIGALLQICDVFIAHLEEGLKANLKSLKPFDPASFANKRSKFSKLSPDKLPNALQEVEQRIEKLQNKANNAGLTWYNLCARSFDKRIVTNWNKYHGTAIVTGLGGAAVLSAYGIWKLGHMAPGDSFIGKRYASLLNILGETAIIGGDGKPVPLSLSPKNNSGAAYIPETQTDNSSLKLPGMIDSYITQILSNHYPLAMIGSTFLWHQYTTTWKTSISPWLDQKKALVWNKLRGGAYLNAETPGLLSLDPKVDFGDMTGLDEVKEEFTAILNYLDNPEQFTRSNAKPEMGWILTGPTRTGKSFSFECLCGEIVKMQKRKGQNDFKFLKIGIDEIGKYGIKWLLDFAKENAPMILFVDEIDLLGLSRVGDNKLLHDFLTAFQTTQTDDPSKVVIVMAATNCPETLDKALRQYGRFGKEMRFEYPGFKYRKQYFIKELTNMALDIRNFDIDALVAKTDSKSYEDIQAIIRSAMTRSWALRVPLTQQMLEDSISREMHKIIMIDRKELPEHETRILASHFAGKALAMTLLDTHATLDKVTTKAVMVELQETTAWYVMHADKKSKEDNKKIVHGGIFTKHLNDTINLKTQEQIINEVKVLLAGFAAEEILLGSCGKQCHKEDYAKAYDILDLMVFEGTAPNQLSENMRNQLHDKAYNLRTHYANEVKQLLTEHRNALAAIADELLQQSILSDKDIQKVIDVVENKTVETPAEAIAATV